MVWGNIQLLPSVIPMCELLVTFWGSHSSVVKHSGLLVPCRYANVSQNSEGFTVLQNIKNHSFHDKASHATKPKSFTTNCGKSQKKQICCNSRHVIIIAQCITNIMMKGFLSWAQTEKILCWKFCIYCQCAHNFYKIHLWSTTYFGHIWQSSGRFYNNVRGKEYGGDGLPYRVKILKYTKL